jgi:hypothetical protein
MIVHLFFGLVEFVGSFLGFDLADHVFEEFYSFQAGFAFVALNVQFHAAVRRDSNVEFALRQRSGGQRSEVRDQKGTEKDKKVGKIHASQWRTLR